MAVRVVERRLGTVPWLVVRGPAAEAFASLGAHLAAEIRAVVEGLPSLAALHRHVASEPGRHRFAAVRRATQSRFPGPWAELAALAAGAGVGLDDLALLNFRGDLGVTGPDPAGAGAGCSDLAWRRQRSFIAHNEDEPDFFAGRCALLTLALDDQQPVATFAKPGFLPATTFTVTGSGLVWGIDHMQARSPGPGAGRHFAARGLQLAASSVDQAISYLREHPSAGGFAYTIGDRAGRIVAVESSAGQHAWREIGANGPVGWHTNHGRYVAGADAGPARHQPAPRESTRRPRHPGRRTRARLVPARADQPAAGRRPGQANQRRPDHDPLHLRGRPHREPGDHRRPGR